VGKNQRVHLMGNLMVAASDLCKFGVRFISQTIAVNNSAAAPSSTARKRGDN
jgi:hypothetical protein